MNDRQTITHDNARNHAPELRDLCPHCRVQARRALCLRTITVGGQPATVSGARNRYATVRRADGTDVEYAWSTVARLAGADPAYV